MKNLKRLGIGIWGVLLQPADECGLFPIVARVGIYGFLLSGILFVSSQRFDDGELLSIVSFVSIVTIIETMWRKTGAGKKLMWHFCALVVLVGFLGVLLNQAVEVREAWYRTNILEQRIQDLIATSPTAIIVADGNGRIKYINEHTTEIIGWEKDELIGRPLTVLMREHKVHAHEIGYHKAVEELKVGSAQWIYTGNQIFRIVTKNGYIVKTQIYIFGIRYSTDEESGIYPLGQDVEFYAIIQPIEPLVDPEEAAFREIERIEEAIQEEIQDQSTSPEG